MSLFALILETAGVDNVERTRPVADETAGRAAWLAAVADPAIRYATLRRTEGPLNDMWRCEWTAQGGFCDITSAHRAETLAHVMTLHRGAPPGYAAALLTGDDRVRFFGPNGEHSLDVAFSSRERVTAHWLGFLPEGTVCVPPEGEGPKASGAAGEAS